MAATLFARMEGSTLDPVDDFSAGDTTWTLNADAAFDNTQVRVGTNSLNCTTGGDRYAQLASAAIVASSQGAFGGWLRFTTIAEFSPLVRAEGTSANDRIQLDVTSTDELRLQYSINGEGSQSIATSALNLATGTWYGYVCRYHNVAANQYNLRIEVYDTTGALITFAEALGVSLFGSQTDIISLTVGTMDGSARCFHDNFMWANDYNEPIQNKLLLTSYTQYNAIPNTAVAAWLTA